MLRFTKTVPYIPDPARSRPFIRDIDRERAGAEPPEVVPFHCKPWVDGQTVGWTLFYGYLTAITIVGLDDGNITVRNGAELARETNQPRIVDQFAEGHFGLGSGYTLQTPPGIVSLILPATNAPQNLEAIMGIIESDWYPRQLFLVYRTPAAGLEIDLNRDTELARVVLIPRHDQLQARALTEAEIADLEERRDAYLHEENETPARWQAASGDSFTHLYKIWSRRNRNK